jgi:hypothetical protein
LPARSVEPQLGGREEEPRFARFASAMDAARAADAPQFALYDEVPGAERVPTPIRGPAGRAPRRPLVRWLGIGSGVLLFGLLLGRLLSEPLGGALARLIGPAPEVRESAAAAATAPAEPSPDLEGAGERQRTAPQRVLPLADARRGPAAPAGAAAAPAADQPGSPALPVPVFKPALAGQ